MAEISSASSRTATKSSRGIFRRGAGGGLEGGDARLEAESARRLSKRVVPAVGSSAFPERTCARVTRGDGVGVGGVSVLFMVAKRYEDQVLTVND
jgi:hypothetical protein